MVPAGVEPSTSLLWVFCNNDYTITQTKKFYKSKFCLLF